MKKLWNKILSIIRSIFHKEVKGVETFQVPAPMPKPKIKEKKIHRTSFGQFQAIKPLYFCGKRYKLKNGGLE